MVNDSKSHRYAKATGAGSTFSQGTPSIIPRVTLSSFGRSKFTWLLQEAWGEEDLLDFLEFSQNLGWNPFRRTTHVGRNVKSAPQPVGKWLLKDDAGNAVAAAEVLVTETGYSCVAVNLLLARHSSSCPRLSEALSYLISALFMITGSDVIHCYVSGGEIRELLAKMPGRLETDAGADGAPNGTDEVAGSIRQIHAVRREMFVCDDDWSIPIKEMNFWEVTPSVWWECESARRDREDLKYLAKRIDNEQRRMEMSQGQRRRMRPFSLFARLFYWR